MEKINYDTPMARTFFPIKIRVYTSHILNPDCRHYDIICDTPNEIPSGKSFKVLETNVKKETKMPQTIHSIVIYPGPSKDYPLSLELKAKDGEILGGTYVNSFAELIKLICDLGLKQEIPWTT